MEHKKEEWEVARDECIKAFKDCENGVDVFDAIRTISNMHIDAMEEGTRKNVEKQVLKRGP